MIEEIPQGVGLQIFERMKSLSKLAERDGQKTRPLETPDGLDLFLHGQTVHCVVRKNGVMLTCVLPIDPVLEFWFDAYAE